MNNLRTVWGATATQTEQNRHERRAEDNFVCVCARRDGTRQCVTS